jgi:hypothetical protein
MLMATIEYGLARTQVDRNHPVLLTEDVIPLNFVPDTGSLDRGWLFYLVPRGKR